VSKDIYDVYIKAACEIVEGSMSFDGETGWKGVKLLDTRLHAGDNLLDLDIANGYLREVDDLAFCHVQQKAVDVSNLKKGAVCDYRRDGSFVEQFTVYSLDSKEPREVVVLRNYTTETDYFTSIWVIGYDRYGCGGGYSSNTKGEAIENALRDAGIAVASIEGYAPLLRNIAAAMGFKKYFVGSVYA
jgi:hypothetical protein